MSGVEHCIYLTLVIPDSYVSKGGFCQGGFVRQSPKLVRADRAALSGPPGNVASARATFRLVSAPSVDWVRVV
jgi:hypothetical protein